MFSIELFRSAFSRDDSLSCFYFLGLLCTIFFGGKSALLHEFRLAAAFNGKSAKSLFVIYIMFSMSEFGVLSTIFLPMSLW